MTNQDIKLSMLQIAIYFYQDIFIGYMTIQIPTIQVLNKYLRYHITKSKYN